MGNSIIRRVSCHKSRTIDGEILQVLTCYEAGTSKEQIKQENRYCKEHDVMKFNGSSYEFIRKNA